MSTAARGDMADLRHIYRDLAAALGAAHRQATAEDGSSDHLAVVNQRVQQLWSQSVERFDADLEQAAVRNLPPVVEPDPQASADLDVDDILDCVGAFDPGTAAPSPQPWAPFGSSGSVRTAALTWCAVAVALAALLGVAIVGPVVLPVFILPVATALLMAWRGTGRAPGVLWALGLTPLVFLVSGSYTSVAFVVLVEGFAYLAYLSSITDGSWQDDLRVQRRPLEIELVLYSLAVWTIRTDVVALLFVACLAGLLWRRRWTAATAAAVTGIALFVELSDRSIVSLFLGHGLVFAVLVAHWARAIFHGPWLASRLSMTEVGLVLSGRAIRGSWRVTQRTMENALSPLFSLGGSGLSKRTHPRDDARDGLRYCWTCHQKTPHKPAGFSLPICQRCVGKADRGGSGRTFSQLCPVCRGRNPHTEGGKCLSCWKKGR